MKQKFIRILKSKREKAINVIGVVMILLILSSMSCTFSEDVKYEELVIAAKAFLELWIPKAIEIVKEIKPIIEVKDNICSIIWSSNESGVSMKLINTDGRYVPYHVKIHGIRASFNERMYVSFLSSLVRTIVGRGEVIKVSELGIDGGEAGKTVTYSVKDANIGGALVITVIYPDIIILQDTITLELIKYAKSKGLEVHIPSKPLSQIRLNVTLKSIKGLTLRYERINSHIMPILEFISGNEKIKVNLYNGEVLHTKISTKGTEKVAGSYLYISVLAVTITSIMIALVIHSRRHKYKKRRRVR